MLPKQDITAYFLDADGSSRDINFTPISEERIVKLLGHLLQKYKFSFLRDQDGKDIEATTETLRTRLHKNEEGFLHGLMKSDKAVMPIIQIFIDWPDSKDKKDFAVEFSYFPADLKQQEFSYDLFMADIQEWWNIAGADEIFIRYENASWNWYDPNDLGVFYHNVRSE